jgi:hypothetical protein
MSRAESPLRGRLIFLVGAQRSGTNWLQSMLATHPDIVALPSETQLISVGVRLLENFVQDGAIEAWSTGRSFMERPAFADAARDFCDAVLGGAATALDNSAGHILERSPNHAEHLDLVAELYPDAKVVHIVRDGRDVARSLVEQPWGPDDVAEAARRWQLAVSVARRHGPSMAGYVEVRYEELLADPAATYQKTLTALDLPASSPIVEAALVESRIPRNVDRSQPWVGSGKWRTTWTPAQLAAFDAEAGALLYEELGYPRLPAVGSESPAAAPDARLTQKAAVVTQRLRSRLGKPTESSSPSEWQQQAQARTSAHEIVGLLARGDFDAARPYLSDDIDVRVVTPESDQRARGAAGIAALTPEISEGGWGRQVRGHVHFAFPMTAVMSSHEKDGDSTDRAVVVFMREAAVTRLVYYRFGSRPAAPA